MKLLSAVRNFIVPPLALVFLIILWPVLFVLHGLGLLMASRRAFTATSSHNSLTLSSPSERIEFPWTDITSASTEFVPPVLAVRIHTASHQSKPMWVRDLLDLQHALRDHHVPLHGLWPPAKPRAERSTP